MRTKRILAASLGAGLALGLFVTGCTSDEGSKNLGTPSASKTDSTTSDSTSGVEAPEFTGSDVEQIQQTYETFSDKMFAIDSDKADEVLNSVSLDENSSDEQKQDFIDAAVDLVPEAWALVDLSQLTLDEKVDYVGSTTYMAVLISTSEGEYKANLDADQITVDGDSATAPGSAISMSVDGVTPDVQNNSAGVSFVKVDDAWRIQAAPITVP